MSTTSTMMVASTAVIGRSRGRNRSGGRTTSSGSMNCSSMLPFWLRAHSRCLKVHQLLVGIDFVKLGLPGKFICFKMVKSDDSLGDAVDGEC